MIEAYKGYTVQIDYDETPADNPLGWTTSEERGAWFIMSHRRYNVPCEMDVAFDEYQSWTELAEAVSNGKPYKFVRWYEHSGIAVSLRDDESGQDWDAGIVGIIIGNTTEEIEAAFTDWKPYVEGEVYTLQVTAPDGKTIECVGSMFGYDYALAAAKEVIEAYLIMPLSERAACYGRAYAKKAQEVHG